MRPAGIIEILIGTCRRRMLANISDRALAVTLRALRFFDAAIDRALEEGLDLGERTMNA